MRTQTIRATFVVTAFSMLLVACQLSGAPGTPTATLPTAPPSATAVTAAATAASAATAGLPTATGAPATALPTAAPRATASPASAAPSATRPPAPATATAAPAATSSAPTAVATAITTPAALPTAPTGGRPGLQLVGQVGGQRAAVAVSGHYTYLAVGPRLLVLDVVEPTQPKTLGQGPILPADIEDVAVADGYAYVAAGDAGLFILNVSDPARPVQVAQYPARGQAKGVLVAFGYVLVAEDGTYRTGAFTNGGLHIFLRNVPDRLEDITFRETEGGLRSLFGYGNYYIYAAGQGGLRVFNMRDPTSPLATYTEAGNASAIAVAGTTAYVLDQGFFKMPGSLHILDISKPAAPAKIAVLTIPSFGCGVAVAGQYLYLCGTSELRVLNVADPAHPADIGIFRGGGQISDMALANGYVYLAGGYGHALRVIDVARPERPLEVSRLDAPRTVLDVAVSGSTAYLADTSGLLAASIADPANPRQVGQSESLYVTGVAVSGSHAFVANNFSLRVFDIADPTNLKEVGAVAAGSAVFRVALVGKLAYLATGFDGLTIVDISNPAGPRVAGRLQGNAQPALDVAVSGSFAYVANGPALRVVDVSRPEQPVEVALLPMPGTVRGVITAGRYAYLAAAEGGLRIVDIANPAAPVEVGSSQAAPSATYPGSDAFGLALAGSTLYLADGSRGLRVIDVSNPAQPRELATYETREGVERVALAGQYIYLAARGSGLIILRAN